MTYNCSQPILSFLITTTPTVYIAYIVFLDLHLRLAGVKIFIVGLSIKINLLKCILLSAKCFFLRTQKEQQIILKIPKYFISIE